jgi:two-component system osmolarity sensor histidine kinase EnvZ
MPFRFKSLVPAGLYGRAALILIVPVVTIQLVVSIAFIQRHFEGVTRQMTQGLVPQVALLLDLRRSEGPGGPETAALAQALAFSLAEVPGPPPAADRRLWWDLTGGYVTGSLRERMPGIAAIELRTGPGMLRMWFAVDGGFVTVDVPRRRVSASNPHQLLVLMILTSVVMTFVAFYFLRAQLRPITKLAEAADAFGKGQHLPYRPRGALEVRAAGRAFLDMRARIERQIDSRTRMLSGISHDLRTPLTRLRLGLSLLPEDDETRALQDDVGQMQRMIDEFLAFARGDAMEEAEPVDPVALARGVVEAAQRGGTPVRLAAPAADAAPVALRPQAVTRALENLVGNAARFGTQVLVTVAPGERHLRLVVEDDGPGIPRDRRDEAMQPFARLDAARDPNRGGGVGLGLSIAADVARSHGGELVLGDSPALGGLRAELVLAR